MKTDGFVEEDVNEIRCELCGATMFEASGRGAYLKRTSPKGEAFKGVCAPNCDRDNGDQDDALLGALGVK